MSVFADFEKKYLNFIVVSVFIILGLSIYSNIYQSPFIFDDIPNIERNPYLRLTELSFSKLHNAASNWICKQRPVVNITLALNYYFHQYDVAGYHLVNNIIHIINGILLFFLFKFTLEIYFKLEEKKDRPVSHPVIIAFVGSLLWFVNPLQTQAVTYIIQRMTSMAAMFYILSVLMYIKGRQSPKQSLMYSYFTISIFSALLAFGSKENTATLPIFIILYELFFFRNLNIKWKKQHIFLIVFCFSFIACFGVFFIGSSPFESELARYAGLDFTVAQRVLTESRVVIFYLSLLLFPHPSRLNLLHDFSLSYSFINPVTTILSFVLIAGLAAIAICFAKKQRLLSFAIIWYFGNLIIESSVIGLDIIFEHRAYLPSIFLFLAVADYFFQLCKFRFIQITIPLIILMVCSYWTYNRNETWRTSLSFWQDTSNKSPDSEMAYTKLGLALKDSGKMNEALGAFQKALKVKPDYDEAFSNIGSILFALNRDSEAIKYYEKTIQLNQNNFSALNNIGLYYFKNKKLKKAIYYFKKALKLVPSYDEAASNLKAVTEIRKKLNDSIIDLNLKLTDKPDDHVILYKLGIVYYQYEEIETAISLLNKAVGVQPVFPQALMKLASLFIEKKDFKKAADYYTRYYKIDSSNPKIPYNIACLYSKGNNTEKAVYWLGKAVKAGYGNWQNIKTDSDLKNIHNTEYFKSLIKIY